MRDASREYARRHGLPLDHAALVSMLDKGEALDKIVHEHGASTDLPTARALDLHTPANVFGVETSPHADIWRHSVACFGSRGVCEMVLDGGGRFIPADIVGVHTLSLLLSSHVAHDRATEDKHTHHTGRASYTHIK